MDLQGEVGGEGVQGLSDSQRDASAAFATGAVKLVQGCLVSGVEWVVRGRPFLSSAAHPLPLRPMCKSAR